MKITFRLSTARSDDVEDGAGAVAVGLDERPRRLVADVLVDLGREPHRLAERGAEAAALDQRADLVEAGVDRREQRAVDVGQLAGLRHLAEVAVRVRERAVDEVAPVREQLVVVAADELGPGEVGVLRLRAGGDEVVAERVGVVALEEVADADRVAAARRELLALHRQVLGRDDVVRQLERPAAGPVLAALAVADQHRRPDDRVEDDVVLALEVVVLRLGVLPPLAPGVRLASHRGPLDRRRQVADHRVEPDVDALVLVLGVALDRDRARPSRGRA